MAMHYAMHCDMGSVLHDVHGSRLDAVAEAVPGIRLSQVLVASFPYCSLQDGVDLRANLKDVLSEEELDILMGR